MTKTIFCTVGTSMIEKTRSRYLPWYVGNSNNPVFFVDEDLDKECRRYNGFRLKADELNEERTKRLFEVWIGEISNKYVKVAKTKEWKNWDDDTWRIMPAEVGSTLRMVEYLEGKEADLFNIHIVLFVSDTAQAYISACVIKDVFQAIGFAPQNIELIIIERFQMEDIEKFTDEGLPNFIRVLREKIDENNKDHQLLNITGGYKNFIPLVTHIASFYGLDMYYVFEEAVAKGKEALVKIPKIPTLNRLLRTEGEDVSILRDILSKINSSNYESFEEALDEIDKCLYDWMPDEVDEYAIEQYKGFIEDFIEQKNNKIQLSMIGNVYLKLIDQSM
ncbi:hypothetical protein QT238_13865 [Geobacillus stearothermophilus]|nr:hypothetical protein QT238_13865 [Geobacillus stearothermophilus]